MSEYDCSERPVPAGANYTFGIVDSQLFGTHNTNSKFYYMYTSTKPELRVILSLCCAEE